MNIEMLFRFFNHIEPKYLVFLFGKAVLIAIAFFLLKKYQPQWRRLGYTVILILFLRIFLFDQYVSWGNYLNHLTVDDVGWRQMSVLEFEKVKFFKKEQPVPFLAVGSSQTHAIFDPYAVEHKELSVFYLSGMGPMDLYLYRDFVASFKPKVILLYLSEFDLAQAPRLEGAKLAPRQGLDLLKTYPKLLEIAKKTNSETELKEMVVSELLPEYKYSFIFKGFSEKLMRKNKALQAESLLKALTPNTEQIKADIEHAQKAWDAGWIKYNRHFLSEFLSYCEDKSLKVIIVEGQYHPWAYTTKSIYLNEISVKELRSLTETFKNVTFIPRSAVIRFGQDDYSDATHVKEKPAKLFVEDLLNKTYVHLNAPNL